ncbi:hypothetical protein BDN67DRAFT_1046784, partial [Paxillus ammoniavirescens]
STTDGCLLSLLRLVAGLLKSPCLQIREILLETLELVFTSEDHYSDLVRVDLSWREQPSLLPLPMCLPREIADIVEYLTRFASLRHLTSFKFAVVGYFASDSYFHLSSVTPSNSFPSLINLSVGCGSAVMVLHIFKTIHSTKLRDLELCLSGFRDHGVTPRLEAINAFETVDDGCLFRDRQ